ncbi:uncharacterized protein [Rutidosis leptorrhynchoides]
MGTSLKNVEVPSSMNSTETLHETKKAISFNAFEQGDEDDNSMEENEQHMGIQMESVDLTPTAEDTERTSVSNEHEEEEDDDRDDSSKEVSIATERTKHTTVTTSQSTVSKALFLGNLSFQIEEDDVRDFFKDVGEIASIRFAIKDERFLGYGYIEFTTAEAAQEALKLNQEVLLDRKVRLGLANERGLYTPNNRPVSMEKPYRRGVQAPGRTIFIRGFDSSVGVENIKSALEKHFGKCGEITRMSIPRDHESGVAKGIAFVDFADYHGVRLALRLDRSEVAGCKLTVEVAKRTTGDPHDANVYGLRNWILASGSRPSGSVSGSGRGYVAIGSVRDSGFRGGLHREIGYGNDSRRVSGSGASWHRESVSGYSWHTERVSGSVSHRESGFGRGPHREGGVGGSRHRESDSGNSWHRDNVSSSSWHRECVSGSVSHRASGYGRGPHREGGASGSGSTWRGASTVSRGRGNESSYGESRGSGFGRGEGRGSVYGGGEGRGSGYGRGSGDGGGEGRGTGYGCGEGRGSGYGGGDGRGGGYGGGDGRGSGYGGGEGRGTGYGRGGFGSSLGYRGGYGGGGRSGSLYGSSRIGGGNGYGSGLLGVGGRSGYSGGRRMGGYSGGFGSGRGRGFSRP